MLRVLGLVRWKPAVLYPSAFAVIMGLTLQLPAVRDVADLRESGDGWTIA